MSAYHLYSGRIVGYYSLLWQEKGECELNNLCALPEYRHSGFGKALLKDAFAQANEKSCAKMNIGIDGKTLFCANVTRITVLYI